MEYTKKELERNAEAIRSANTYNVNGYTIFLMREKLAGEGAYFRIRQIYPSPEAVRISVPAHGDDYTIQTTSWGSLSIEEIEKKIKLYQNAIKTVKWLKKFDWNKTDIII